MQWSVVKFPKEHTVEVVPTSWYVDSSKECFWPPPKTKRIIIATLIKNCEEPQSDWAVYHAILLGQYYDLNTAQRKANKAQTTSDLSSNSECLTGRGYRQKKHNVKYATPSDSSSIESSGDENIYPKIPKDSFRSIVQPNFETPQSTSGKGEIGHYSESFAAAVPASHEKSKEGKALTAAVPASHEKSKEGKALTAAVPASYGKSKEGKALTALSSLNIKPRRSRSTPPDVQKKRFRSHSDESLTFLNTTPDEYEIAGDRRRENTYDSNEPLMQREGEEGFKKVVLEELSLINVKIDSLLDKMIALTKVLALGSATVSAVTDANLQHLYEKLPIKDEEGMLDLENWLKEKNNYKIMLLELHRIGGSGLSQSVRKILYRVFANEIAQNYSWDGAKRKKCFKQLRLSNVILDATKIQYKDVSETEIINVIKLWLVKAKERLRLKQHREKQVENEVGEAGDRINEIIN